MQPESFRDFELVASPPGWYEVAKGLNEQAAVLYRDQSTLIQFTNHKGVTHSRYGTNRGVFLLAGFSVENLLKAFLIYENPAYISRGMLANQLRTHQLTKLWQTSRFVPYKNRYIGTVAALEDGLESWARYPCGLTYNGKSFENEMTEKLWSSYNGMFASCSKRLEHLLTKGFETSSGERNYMHYEHSAKR